jgi:hypothetical protein
VKRREFIAGIGSGQASASGADAIEGEPGGTSHMQPLGLAAEAADEVTISEEPAQFCEGSAQFSEASAQSAVIQTPEQTAPKRRAPRVKLHPVNANVARVYPPDGDAKLW